jgi:hypothetical protein
VLLASVLTSIVLLAPPALEGTPRVGETVRAVAATWDGGVGDDLRIDACRDEAATRCETLAAPDWEFETKRDGTVVIGAKYAGWYLRVANWREDQGDVRPAVIYDRAVDVPVLTAGPRVAFSGLVGPVVKVDAPYVKPAEPVTGVPSPPAAPKPPVVTLYRTARRDARGIAVGSVTCSTPCTAQYTVSDGRRTLRRSRVGSGTLVLKAKVRKGTLKVSVSVDALAPVAGRVRLR